MVDDTVKATDSMSATHILGVPALPPEAFEPVYVNAAGHAQGAATIEPPPFTPMSAGFATNPTPTPYPPYDDEPEGAGLPAGPPEVGEAPPEVVQAPVNAEGSGGSAPVIRDTIIPPKGAEGTHPLTMDDRINHAHASLRRFTMLLGDMTAQTREELMPEFCLEWDELKSHIEIIRGEKETS